MAVCPSLADILFDDYSLKRTLKMKHTTPDGLAVTSKSEHNKGVSSGLEAKFFHEKSGITIDRAKVRTQLFVFNTVHGSLGQSLH